MAGNTCVSYFFAELSSCSSNRYWFRNMRMNRRRNTKRANSFWNANSSSTSSKPGTPSSQVTYSSAPVLVRLRLRQTNPPYTARSTPTSQLADAQQNTSIRGRAPTERPSVLSIGLHTVIHHPPSHLTVSQDQDSSILLYNVPEPTQAHTVGTQRYPIPIQGNRDAPELYTFGSPSQGAFSARCISIV